MRCGMVVCSEPAKSWHVSSSLAPPSAVRRLLATVPARQLSLPIASSSIAVQHAQIAVP